MTYQDYLVLFDGGDFELSLRGIIFLHRHERDTITENSETELVGCPKELTGGSRRSLRLGERLAIAGLI